MKFNFAVFMGHEMPFMEIHGIFIKMWFIVNSSARPLPVQDHYQ